MNHPVIIIVCGGRDYHDRDYLFHQLDSFHEQYHISLLINGGARGADRLSTAWAISRGIKFKEFPADWIRFRKSAGPIRNKQMLDHIPRPNFVIAFPGGPGTANMIAQAEEAGIKVKYGR